MYPMKKDLGVRLLNVDLGNFRIGAQDNPRAAYQAMIEEEGQDLVTLAADIVELGLSPAELFMVCPDLSEPGHFIVCDGNRRFTSLKLLETPALADGTAVHKDFKELAKAYAKNRIREVSTVIFADKESAMPWIQRRHLDLGGKGMSQWGGAATGRAEAFTGNVRASKAVMDFLRNRGQLPATLERTLNSRTTNLDRVLQMPYMAAALGVTIGKDGAITFGNGDEKKGGDLLVRMVKAMAAPTFNVNSIRLKEERQDFIDSFAKHHVQADDVSSDPVNPGGPKPPPGKKKPRKKSPSQDDRKTLALRGRDYVLSIVEPRLNELYGEATKLQPADLPNCSSILTRVIVELSTDHFLSKKRVALPAKHVNKGRKSWREKGISLEEKLANVLKVLDPTGKDPVLKHSRTALSDDDALHSITSLHDYVHKLSADPDPKEIKRIWKRWHPYLDRLFAALS